MPDPLEGAHALERAGRPADAYAALAALPETHYPDPPRQIDMHHTMQRCLLSHARATDDATLRLALFFRAQKAFFWVAHVDYGFEPAYRVQADFWTLIGRPDEAAKLLRNAASVVDNRALAKEAAALSATSPGRPTPQEASEDDAVSARVLVLLSPSYDPAMDVLFEGLCGVLGPENVVEYPWKPLLHGERAAEADNYPTTFRQPGSPRDLDWVCTRLAEGFFDLVLYGDMLKSIPREAMARIVAAAGDTPLFIVDGWDDASDNQRMMLEHLGIAHERIGAYFKREMIAGVDYGPKAIPLPLSYPLCRVPDPVPARRTQALFWAGNRFYGLRRLYLEHLEAMTGLAFDTKYTQEDYARALDTSLIGISLRGFGFDTVRYWEVPAHGGALLAERTPLVIPHDFVDGETALFFDDLPGFTDRLAWCLDHLEAVARIAAAGHRHFLRYHTGEARARQLLAHCYRRRKGMRRG